MTPHYLSKARLDEIEKKKYELYSDPISWAAYELLTDNKRLRAALDQASCWVPVEDVTQEEEPDLYEYIKYRLGVRTDSKAEEQSNG